MWIILKYFLRQFLNYWKHLPLRIKIEIVILLTVFYIYGTNQLVFKFRSFIEQPDITSLHLHMLVQLVLLLPLLTGIPFIYFSLIPRQKSIQLLRLLPLSSGQSAMLLLVHLWKYELIYLIIILPVATAVGITLGLWPFFYLLILLCLLPSVLFLFLHLLATIFSARYKILFMYLGLVILYYLFLLGIHLTPYYLLYQIAIYIFLTLIVYRFWFIHREKWDIIPDRFSRRPVDKKQMVPFGTINYFTLASYVPLAIRPVFIKEILLQIRNNRYLRLKVLTIIFFLLGSLLIQQYAAENFRNLLALLVVVLIWWHYSSQFNEKYVLPESKYFLKTMPLRYYQFVLPKFLAELIYIIILTCLLLLIFLLHGEELPAASIAVLSMFMVSIFILFITIIFKTMFYDNPRLAGYAYHLLILFSLVVSVNFYFVGPLITIFLLLYFSYKSYQAFSQ